MSAAARHVLILGGTAEAARLAADLAGDQGLTVTSSLAGRVREPRLPPGRTRIGGFGGPAGLARWLREHRVDAVIDATHPFAATIGFHAAEAAADVHVPLLAVRRPGWVAGPGDRWHPAASTAAAAELLPGLAERAFLTVGRTGIAAFAGATGLWFLARAVEAPGPPVPPRMHLLLERGPFTVDAEADLLRRYRIDAVVTKDSGGTAGEAKLVAAREAGVPVVVVTRPPVPEGVPAVCGPEQAAAWLRGLLGLHPDEASGLNPSRRPVR
ncbi:cobalt-precorrin-6A reductase [Streptomyces meridianus]|uniref:Cobalt-precorrin-6A reductase n=1 Tax=Streptomyces meridianus TaxID=2938945 RepID=A0ABT0XAU0_9ACTN|nr:cobalt-precorrin-6A reductase [Streptomyces meridianus]MCM2579638.1 cobalt-precorrin-6A reductase [Streptomyces meridianus]